MIADEKAARQKNHEKQYVFHGFLLFIDVKNDFDAKILINGVPDHRLIIADKESGFLEALELQISEHFKEKNNNHEQRGC